MEGAERKRRRKEGKWLAAVVASLRVCLRVVLSPVDALLDSSFWKLVYLVSLSRERRRCHITDNGLIDNGL